MITDKNDGRASNPYLYKRTNPEPKQMYEENVHVACRVYNKRKKKWQDGYKTLRCGKHRQAVIEDMSLDAIAVSKLIKVPAYEIVSLRMMYGLTPTTAQPIEEKEIEKSQYLQLMEATYLESYETVPLGSRGPVHQESYLAQNKDDGRLLEVRYRNITQYGNKY